MTVTIKTRMTSGMPQTQMCNPKKLWVTGLYFAKFSDSPVMPVQTRITEMGQHRVVHVNLEMV